MKEYRLNIDPHPAPRMVGRYPTKRTERYKEFRKELLMRARLADLRDLPPAIGFTFEIKMPKSWSQAKKNRMRGQIHQQKPDLDNLIKAVLDSFTYGRHLDDSYVGTFLFAQKIWADKGRIVIWEVDPEEKNPVEKLMETIKTVLRFFKPK
jgi:Holliday junction resolvase RusA-like endonuclease